MNIFVLDNNPKTCAEYHCDKHVVKMILETAQMMSTVLRKQGIDAGYKKTHQNHPCTLWLGESLGNWKWLNKMVFWLNEEYKKRYGHDKNHKSFDVIQSLPEPDYTENDLTEFALAMPDSCKKETAVESYRDYYKTEKRGICTWKGVSAPLWF